MIAYALTRDSLGKVKAAYQQRMAHISESEAASLRGIETGLGVCRTAEEVFEKAAGLYSPERGNSSLFACFHHNHLNLEVSSVSGALAGSSGRAEFISDNPPFLMGKVLGDRLSLHLQNLAGLDRRSFEQRIADTGGRQVFGAQDREVELVDEEGAVLTQWYYSRQLLGVLPMNFRREQGAMLLTPLGIENSTVLAFGLICEYREQGPFDPASIRSARNYSALFTQEIVKREIEELQKPDQARL